MNNDLISRSALMELAHNHVGRTVDCNDIARFPAVDAEVVRHGIPVAHYETWCNSDGEPVTTFPCGYECPFCGDVDIKKFCPNCGAKMDAEVEG